MKGPFMLIPLRVKDMGTRKPQYSTCRSVYHVVHLRDPHRTPTPPHIQTVNPSWARAMSLSVFESLALVTVSMQIGYFSYLF